MRLRNFRCFQDETEVGFSRFTTIVGRNDSGKSSVMDALEIFLNDKAPDGDDACKTGEARNLVITCEFTAVPGSIVLDSSAETSLADEYLLNERGNLEIVKSFSGHLANPKLSSVHACAVHPSADGVDDLLQLKNAALKQRARDLGADLRNVDQTKNPLLRDAIRTHVGDLNPSTTLVPLYEENGKDVWSALSIHVPTFQLFRSDRASTDQDPEAQDPLKMAVREALKQREQELQDLLAHVESHVRGLAEATLRKLKEMDPSLAQELTPSFTKPKWDGLFKASFVGDQGIPMNKRGSGVKRLLLLNFFRAKAEIEARRQNRTAVIYGIEEPETSQHPQNQRLLLRALTDLSAESQVIITTHTPMLARALPEEGLRYIEVGADAAKTRRIRLGGSETNALIAGSLGILPDNSVKLFVGVEGPHDIRFLHGMSKAMRHTDPGVPNLEQLELNGEVIFFPLGGSTLALWTSRLLPLNRPEFHLFDRDEQPPRPSKYQAAIDEINKRDRCVALCTDRRETESYLHGQAIRAAYAAVGISVDLPDSFEPFDDVPEIVAMAVHAAASDVDAWSDLTHEKRDEKASKAKRFLNMRAVDLMTPAMIDDTGALDEVASWFRCMQEMMREPQS